MIIVTGGAGFIGSNIVRGLNVRGQTDILIVDDLKNSAKSANIRDLQFHDYVDRWDFMEQLDGGGGLLHRFKKIDAVFHHGACASMTEPDGAYVMRTNFKFSKLLSMSCIERRIPMIYASSTAVYEFDRKGNKEEKPRNLYGMSKLLFDRYITENYLKQMNTVQGVESQMVGLRYFCVYGPRERHKGDMASIITKGYSQLLETEQIRLFKGFDGYEDGEHRRDFTYVGDLVDVNLWFLDHREKSGIFEVGSGVDRSFNEAADAIIDFDGGIGKVTYIDPPERIIQNYQSFSRADNTKLREAGYIQEFTPLGGGVRLTLSQW